jgi:hypothetical protein
MGIRHVYLGGDKDIGTEVQIEQDTWNVIENIGSKSIFSFVIKDLNGATIDGGTEVTFYEDTTLLWGGYIKDLEDYSPGTGRLEYIVSATDYNELVERCLVIKGFYNETIEDMVTYLIDNFFTSYGITAGTISAITVVNKVPLGYVFGHSTLNHLRNFGNYVWNIDKNKQLSFQQIGYSISGTPINDAALTSTINNFRRNRSMQNYRNRQYVRGHDRLSVQQIQKTPTPTPNSSHREFFVKYKIGLEPFIEVNTGSGWVVQTVGLIGLDEGESNQWWWSYGSSQITHDENETVLTATDEIRVTYYGLIPLIIVTQDSDEVSSRGYYDSYDYNEKLEDLTDALQFGNNLLEKYANTADTFTYRMYSKVYEPGEQVQVSMSTLRVVDETFLVKGCTWTPRSINTITYDYEILDSPNVGGWEDFFKNLIKATRITVDTDEIVIYVKEQDETIDFTGQYNITEIDPLEPSDTLYPANDLYPGEITDSFVVND